ncbi:MAG: hypothetical protein ABSG96_08705 [Terracidiphilus sp.]|jgi:hypothetical protein
MDEILIDRLVFEVPGIGPDVARQVAEKVGAGLAAGTNLSGGAAIDRLAIEWDEQRDGRDPAKLAEAILQAVMRQIG